jgi:hypothetical protein
MNLSEPRLRRVWPGSGSAERPEGEVRLLSQMMLTCADVRKAVTDRAYAQSCGFSGPDIALLRRALGDPPQARRARQMPGGLHPSV